MTTDSSTTPALAGRQAILLLTTGGSSESFQPAGTFGLMGSFLYQIQRGMLEFVGYRVLHPVITYGPARMTTDERRAALDAVSATFTLIAPDS